MGFPLARNVRLTRCKFDEKIQTCVIGSSHKSGLHLLTNKHKSFCNKRFDRRLYSEDLVTDDLRSRYIVRNEQKISEGDKRLKRRNVRVERKRRQQHTSHLFDMSLSMQDNRHTSSPII